MPLWQLAWSSSHSSAGVVLGTAVVGGGGVGAVERFGAEKQKMNYPTKTHADAEDGDGASRLQFLICGPTAAFKSDYYYYSFTRCTRSGSSASIFLIWNHVDEGVAASQHASNGSLAFEASLMWSFTQQQ